MTGANLRPFRVAFWALLAALGLSVVVTLSDPRSVRLAILAKSELPGEDQSRFAAVITRSRDDAAVTLPDAVGSSRASEDRLGRPSARQVSSPLLRIPDDAGVSPGEREGTMPVLSPTRLQQNSVRGEYFELPPPPEWDLAAVPRPPDLAFGPSMPDFGPSLPETASRLFSPHATSPENDRHDEQNRILQQQLETEVARLKRELDRLTQSQQIGHQLDQLHRQQQQILSLHRQLPVDRLTQLVDSLLVQLQSVRDTISPADQPRATMPGESSLLVGEGSHTQPGRVSIRITEARLDEILAMLSTLSGTTIVTVPETGLERPVSKSVTPERVDRSEKSRVGNRTVKSPETASKKLTDPNANPNANPNASGNSARRKPTEQSAPPGSHDDSYFFPESQSAAPPPQEAHPQPVSAQQDVKRTASASSCVACHRAKGIR